MACNIHKFKLTESQIKRWCNLGCSVDCEKLLAEKYKLKEEYKDKEGGVDENRNV